MAANSRTQPFETEIPAQLFAEMQFLVKTGWFRTVEDVMQVALRRFLDLHREKLMEGFLRQDVEWGLHGRD